MKIDFVIKAKMGLIYDYMRANNLDQKQMAIKCGISYTMFNNILNFRYKRKDPLHSGYVENIANTIGCTVEDLYPPELTQKVRLKLAKGVVVERNVEILSIERSKLPELEAGDQYIPGEQDNEINTDELKHHLNSALYTLTPREKKILEMRFGLNGLQEEKTTREVAAYYYITPQRVRQITAKALRKLRHPSRSKYLKQYINV